MVVIGKNCQNFEEMMKNKIMNDPSEIVSEMIEGLLLTQGSLRRVGSLPVVVRHDIETIRHEKVAVISGGGRSFSSVHI